MFTDYLQLLLLSNYLQSLKYITVTNYNNDYKNNNFIFFLYLIDITISGRATNQSITSIPEAVDFRLDIAAVVSPKSKNNLFRKYLIN